MTEGQQRTARAVLKYALYGCAAALVALGAAVAYFAATFEPRDYHAEFVQLVKERTGRTLKIDGEMALSIWPDVAVRVAAVSLSERDSEERFATADNIRMRLELTPLFSREIVVTEIEFVGTRVLVRRDKHGRLNIDDLLRSEGAAPRIDIQKLTIERGAVSFQDDVSGARYEITGLALNAGRIKEGLATPITTSFSARDAQQSFAVDAAVKGRFTSHAEAKRHSVQDVRVEIKGRAAGVSAFGLQASGGFVADLGRSIVSISPFKLSLATPHQQDVAVEVEADGGTVGNGSAAAEGVRVGFSAQHTAGKVEGRVAVPAISVARDRVQAASASLDLTFAGGRERVEAVATSALEVELSRRRVVLSRLVGRFTARGDRLPEGGISGSLEGDGYVDARKKTLALRASGKADGTTVRAHVTRRGGVSPVYAFSLDLGELDLDRYRPRAATGNTRQESAPAAARELLAPLVGLPATGSVNIGVLKVAGARAKDVRVVLE